MFSEWNPNNVIGIQMWLWFADYTRTVPYVTWFNELKYDWENKYRSEPIRYDVHLYFLIAYMKYIVTDIYTVI